MKIVSMFEIRQFLTCYKVSQNSNEYDKSRTIVTLKLFVQSKDDGPTELLKRTRNIQKGSINVDTIVRAINVLIIVEFVTPKLCFFLKYQSLFQQICIQIILDMVTCGRTTLRLFIEPYTEKFEHEHAINYLKSINYEIKIIVILKKYQNVDIVGNLMDNIVSSIQLLRLDWQLRLRQLNLNLMLEIYFSLIDQSQQPFIILFFFYKYLYQIMKQKQKLFLIICLNQILYFFKNFNEYYKEFKIYYLKNIFYLILI